MIFSEEANSFSLYSSPFTSKELIKTGLWLTLMGINEIPPHIALIYEGKYYSQSAKKVDCGSSIERVMNILERKSIPTLFVNITIDSVIARNEAISLLEKTFRNIQPLQDTENTCLSPIKTFFAKWYSAEFENVNYVFELLALAGKKGLIKECTTLFCENTNSNIVTLPKYTMAQIKNKIQEVSTQLTPTK